MTTSTAEEIQTLETQLTVPVSTQTHRLLQNGLITSASTFADIEPALQMDHDIQLRVADIRQELHDLASLPVTGEIAERFMPLNQEWLTVDQFGYFTFLDEIRLLEQQEQE